MCYVNNNHLDKFEKTYVLGSLRKQLTFPRCRQVFQSAHLDFASLDPLYLPKLSKNMVAG